MSALPVRPSAEHPPAAVVVLGDTRDLHHHGCEAVLGQLLGGLAESGLAADPVIAGFDWQTHEAACLAAGLVIINGEGALHHDRPVVERVLELAERRRGLRKATALINSSWFENSVENTRRLACFDLLAMRDPVSREALGSAGLDCLDAPDLAIREALRQARGGEVACGDGLVVSDSTQAATTRLLRQWAERQGARYLPILYPPQAPRDGAKSRKIHRKVRLARLLGPLARPFLSPRYHAHLAGLPDLGDYCRALRASAGAVTGRFHTACLCVGLRVPFVALRSNTAKIESLVRDAGLDPSLRLIEASRLETISRVPPFSASEQAALEGFCAESEVRFETLFRRLRDLADSCH